MGLLDDVPEPMKSGRRGRKRRDNFADLQNFDRHENSQDFADSAFADREEHHCTDDGTGQCEKCGRDML